MNIRNRPIKKIMCSVIAIMFFVNNLAYGLAPGIVSGELRPDGKEVKGDMYAAGQKLFAAKRGPGAIDIESYLALSGFSGNAPAVAGLKFVASGYKNGVPEGWSNNLLLSRDVSGLVEALKIFRDQEAKLTGRYEIVEGYFDVDKTKGELPISRWEFDRRKGVWVLVVHHEFVKMWNDIKANDVWFEYTFPDGKTRTVSLAWAIFYRVAKHEMSDLQKAGGDPKSIGHITNRGAYFGVTEEESTANAIGGRYNIINDALWMWFLGSYAFGASTQRNNDTLRQRLEWFFGGSDARDMKLNLEFPNLLQDDKARKLAVDLALAVNFEFYLAYQSKPAGHGDAARAAHLKREYESRKASATDVLPATGSDGAAPERTIKIEIEAAQTGLIIHDLVRGVSHAVNSAKELEKVMKEFGFSIRRESTDESAANNAEAARFVAYYLPGYIDTWRGAYYGRPETVVQAFKDIGIKAMLRDPVTAAPVKPGRNTEMPGKGLEGDEREKPSAVTQFVPYAYTVATRSAGDIQVGSPPELIKHFMRNKRPVPSTVVLPKQNLIDGINYADIEFVCYFNFFVNKGKKVTIIGTAEQAERVRAVLRETLIGPSVEEMVAAGMDKREASGLKSEFDYFNKKKDGTLFTIDDFVEFVTFDGQGATRVGDVTVRATDTGFNIEEDGRTTVIPHAGDGLAAPEAMTFPDKPFRAPEFGVTFVGNSTGFDPAGLTTSFITWWNGRGMLVDPLVYSVNHMRSLGINPEDVRDVFLSHVHGDHDAGLMEMILNGHRVNLITSRVIFESFLRKAKAITGQDLRSMVTFVEARPGERLHYRGGSFDFSYGLHSIPCLRFRMSFRGRSLSYSGDTRFEPEFFKQLKAEGVIDGARAEDLLNHIFGADIVIHEAGGLPLHTQVPVLSSLPEELKRKIYVVHSPKVDPATGLKKPAKGESINLLADDMFAVPENEDILAMRTVGFFDQLDLREILLLTRKAKPVTYHKGDTIIRQGDSGDNFYVISSGEVEVTVKDDDGNVKHRVILGKGSSFGEQALLKEGRVRNATVTALTDVRLLSFDRARFGELLDEDGVQASMEKVDANRQFLSKVPAFTKLPQRGMVEVCNIAETVTYNKGDLVIRQGEPGDSFFVIKSGSVDIVDETTGRTIDTKKSGDVLGEIALLRDTPRTATVRVSSDKLEALVIKRADFNGIVAKYPYIRYYLEQLSEERLRNIETQRRAAALKDAGRAVTEGEISAAIDWINTKAGKEIFAPDKKRDIIGKILSMGLVKGKRFLVVGPGVNDYMPVLLAKLGLDTTTIDTEPSNAEYMSALAGKFGLTGMSNVSSYDEIKGQAFEYISMFGVLNDIASATDRLIAGNIVEIQRLNSSFTMEAQERDARIRYHAGIIRETCEAYIMDALDRIAGHLNERGTIFVNAPMFAASEQINAQVDYIAMLESVLNAIGAKRGLRFVRQGGVDVDDLSMTLIHLNEERRGAAYMMTPVAPAVDRRADGTFAPRPGKSPSDALAKVMARSDRLRKAPFTIAEYIGEYNRIAALHNDIEPNISESTARNDLYGDGLNGQPSLVKQGLLKKSPENAPNGAEQYELTDEGRSAIARAQHAAQGVPPSDTSPAAKTPAEPSLLSEENTKARLLAALGAVGNVDYQEIYLAIRDGRFEHASALVERALDAFQTLQGTKLDQRQQDWLRIFTTLAKGLDELISSRQRALAKRVDKQLPGGTSGAVPSEGPEAGGRPLEPQKAEQAAALAAATEAPKVTPAEMDAILRDNMVKLDGRTRSMIGDFLTHARKLPLDLSWGSNLKGYYNSKGLIDASPIAFSYALAILMMDPDPTISSGAKWVAQKVFSSYGAGMLWDEYFINMSAGLRDLEKHRESFIALVNAIHIEETRKEVAVALRNDVRPSQEKLGYILKQAGEQIAGHTSTQDRLRIMRSVVFDNNNGDLENLLRAIDTCLRADKTAATINEWRSLLAKEEFAVLSLAAMPVYSDFGGTIALPPAGQNSIEEHHVSLARIVASGIADPAERAQFEAEARKAGDEHVAIRRDRTKTPEERFMAWAKPFVGRLNRSHYVEMVKDWRLNENFIKVVELIRESYGLSRPDTIEITITSGAATQAIEAFLGRSDIAAQLKSANIVFKILAYPLVFDGQGVYRGQMHKVDDMAWKGSEACPKACVMIGDNPMKNFGFGNRLVNAESYAEAEVRNALLAFQFRAPAAAAPATVPQEEAKPAGEIIAEYVARIARESGPGAIPELTQQELRAVWEMVGLLHDSRIEILLPKHMKLTESMKKALDDIRKRDGGDVIKCREYTDADHLGRMLEQPPAPGVKRMVITEDAVKSGITGLATAQPDLFKEIRLYNITLPRDYDSMTSVQKTVCQARAINIAILMRLFEKGKTPMVEMLLRIALEGRLDDGVMVDDFINRIAEDGAASTINRILWFLGKTVSLVEKLGKELRLLKEVWTAA